MHPPSTPREFNAVVLGGSLVFVSDGISELNGPSLVCPLLLPQIAGGVGKSALTLRFVKGYFVETVSLRISSA